MLVTGDALPVVSPPDAVVLKVNFFHILPEPDAKPPSASFSV